MGRFVPIREAAQLFGVSDDTIKKRMKLGELAGEKEKIRTGFRWLVQLPDDLAAPAESHPGASETHSCDATEQLSRLVTFLTEELEARRKEVSELHILLGQAQGKLRAPYELPSTTVSTGERTPVEGVNQPQSEPPSKPWWRFWHRSPASAVS